MKYLNDLKNQLKTEKESAERNLKEAKRTRDNAASAMESQHDMTRARAESEIKLYKKKIRDLKDSIDKVPSQVSNGDKVRLWYLVKIELDQQLMEVVVVPENMGGKKIDEVRYISEEAPVGQSIMGKSVGEKISFNDKSGKIVSIA